MAASDRGLKFRHRLIPFEDWRPGEYGVRPPSQAGPNQFTGLNVCRYDNGLLGPRNGLKLLVPSGSTPVGVVRGFGHNPTLTGVGVKSMWVAVDAGVVLSNSDQTSGVVAAGSFNVSLTAPVYGVSQGAMTYITGSQLDGVYALNHIAATLVKITGSPATADFICQYGECLLTTGPFNLVRYSAPSDPNTWPAGNFFRVGPAASFIQAAVPQRDHLIFSKLEGGFWLMRGNLDQTGGIQTEGTSTIRRISGTQNITSPDGADVLQNELIVLVHGSVTPNGHVPSIYMFDGSSLLEPVPYIEWALGDGTFYDNARHQVLALMGPSDWMCMARPALGAGDSIMHVNGAYSRHTFDPPGAFYPAILRNLVRGATRVWMGDMGAVATQAQFWYFEPYQRRVAFTSDGTSQPGDGSTTPLDAYFTTYEWVSDTGYEAKVAAVTVDFRCWTTGSASSNHFDLNVITTKAIDANGPITSATQSFDDPSGSLGAATTAGVDLSRRFGFGGSAWGRGFKIKVSALRGIAIERITAHVDVRESRSI